MINGNTDWHSADVKCALAKAGTNLAKLAREHDLAPSTLRNVFRFRCPKYERIVAEAIGKTPDQIWPSRYESKCA
ncbi:TPA: helix-turn-helix domain-containing protein [Aeromonas veronii]|uniref:helix-turn-helix domain-containing protein n=1 Tax=Aeromonas TaxID=642 RepID=UPI0026EC4BBC|nr:helix-turn-helix transcriptional regulator [Aeromonas sobria]HDO1327598.1 helix-turn-helix domain-containing protein [Aeromonas veronii]HDO1332123.1 helix-turn-helix domain-containing protein [Aeromonas veronii]HDO1339039.1 helix-turn-helix domain-containing protein [Aeromonas veronii]HDO1341182.1 helix-turn-helix domain-containing protein [Aeromonas veronii]HDO1345756.1 helix-turn-helix domain-containing protein [Aeromonas veronii]